MDEQNNTGMLLEIEKLAMEEETVRRQLNKLKNILFFGEDYNKKFSSDTHNLELKIQQVNQAVDDTNRYLELVNSNLESTRGSSMLLAIAKKLIEKNEPSLDQQMEKINQFKKNYSTTLAKYEENPIYKSILKAESDGQELEELIKAKRTEMMKLETQQEF